MEPNSLAEKEQTFVKDILEARTSGTPAEATLHTDDRVLARITDGIYRQPSSALRELISNAYDADATSVYVTTDAPRFSQMRIRDNGTGMNAAALSRLIHHIGGSSKRTNIGSQYGTTKEGDPLLSPSGRRLIGKIGIGLFSVSQLTSHFQIITKVKGDSFRLMADVVLRTYSEDDIEPTDGTFETGTVKVFPIETDDVDSHGTEIILLNVRPRARDILRSKDRWLAWLDESEKKRDKPVFHAGFVEQNREQNPNFDEYKIEPELPWKATDEPITKFKKLFDAMASQVGVTVDRPDLARTLDSYLSTIWTLSLAAPVSYIEKHPFDITIEDEIDIFKIVNDKKGQAEPVELHEGQRVRDVLNLKSGHADPLGCFQVFVDEVELRRPISFRSFPEPKQKQTRPMLFVGSFSPNLSSIDISIRGGDLSFEAYLFWNSKIVPKENTGVLVRVNGASGALFDDTFMKYPISEQTRLRQITSEIFVKRGLDAALNIDRESFNFAHPHYQLLSNWIHKSLKQLANTHKAIGDRARQVRKEAERLESRTKLEKFVERKWSSVKGETAESFPEVRVVETPLEAEILRKSGETALIRSALFSVPKGSSSAIKMQADQRLREAQAIVAILDAYGVLENMPYTIQNELVDAIVSVFYEDAQG